MNVATFKANLKAAANDRQSALFAQADAIDAKARKEVLGTAKRARVHAEAETLRSEAYRIGDHYHSLVVA